MKNFYIDSHCHIDFDWFDEDRDDIVEKAKSANVQYLINIGCEKKSNINVRNNALKYDNVFFTSGIHPSDVMEADDTVFDQIKEFANDENMVAVGEIGLDYYKYDGDRDRQKQFFRTALKTAIELKKPVVIHNRDAHDDLEMVLKEENIDQIGGVMHCFAGTADYATRMVEMGLHISFTGNITFKNAKYDDVIAAIPMERILLETDSPFLTPHPHRGKRNDPSYIPLIAEKISDIKKIPVDVVRHLATENTIRLFNLPL